MPEQVILEFVGDPTGLKPLADAMGALGQITDAQSASLKKATEAFNQRKQAIVAGEKAAQDAIAASTANLSKEAAQMAAVSKGLEGIGKAITGGNIKQATETFKKVGDNLGAAATKAVGLKAQLVAMKKELQGLEVGSQKFNEISTAAAKLEDKIGDVNERIRVMAKDTFAFDAVVDGVRGITAAFSLAQAGSALLGDENENLQKTLVKLNALMLVSTSLQELSNQLTGQGAAKLAIESAAKRIYTFVTEGATLATKAFNAALVGLGIGTIVFLLYEAANAMGIFTEKTKDNTKATEAAKQKQEELAKAEADAAQARAERLANLKKETDELTKSKSQLLAQENVASKQRIAQIDEELDTYNKANATLDDLNKQLANGVNVAFFEESGQGDALRASIKTVYEFIKKEGERVDAELLQAERARLAASVAANIKAIDEIAAEKAKKDAKPSRPTFLGIKGMEVDKTDFDAKQKELADAKVKAEKDAADAIKQSEQEVAAFEEQLRQEKIAQIKEETNEEIAEAERAEKLKKDIRQDGLQAMGAIFDAAFQIMANNLQAETNAQLKASQETMDALLANEELTEGQKQAIREQYRRKEAEIKKQAWEKQKQADLASAAIKTALAVVNALDTAPPASFVAAALAAGMGAAQIAVIAAQPTPQFAEGTEYVLGAGTTTSDSIHAKLSVGERVVPAAINEKLVGIKNSDLPKLAAMANMLPHIPSDIMAQFEANQSTTFDYKLMAKELSTTLANATKPVISIDKAGINILLTKGNRRAVYLNNRYLQ